MLRIAVNLGWAQGAKIVRNVRFELTTFRL